MSKIRPGRWLVFGIGVRQFDVRSPDWPTWAAEGEIEEMATLIAAAPALAAICEETADALESNDPDLSLYWLADRLRAALSKARGEPSPAPGAEGVLTVALEVGEGGNKG